MGPKSNDKGLYKKKDTETQAQRRQPREDRGRVWSNIATAKDAKDCLEPLEAGRTAWGGLCLGASSGLLAPWL